LETKIKVSEIVLDKIESSVFKPRSTLDQEKLKELTQSIKTLGVIQGVLLRPKGEGFEIVIGERRVRAAKRAGLDKIPANIRDISDREALEMILIENVQREDLSAVDKGKLCKMLMEKFPEEYPTQNTLGDKLGVAQSHISDWIRLVEAPKEIQELIAPVEKRGEPVPRGKIDYRTAAEIVSKIKKPARQVALAREIARRHIPAQVARRVIKKVELAPERPVKEIFREAVREEASPVLPFMHHHQQLILKGIKTQTSRKGLPANLKKGGIAKASVGHFADLEITDIYTKKLREFDEEDAQREGGYTLEEFKKVWIGLHGEWNPDETVNVIRFRVAKVV